MELIGVNEYCEGLPVEIIKTTGGYKSNSLVLHGEDRLVIKASNEGGYSSTEVDLIELIEWIKVNKPELLDVVKE